MSSSHLLNRFWTKTLGDLLASKRPLKRSKRAPGDLQQRSKSLPRAPHKPLEAPPQLPKPFKPLHETPKRPPRPPRDPSGPPRDPSKRPPGHQKRSPRSLPRAPGPISQARRNARERSAAHLWWHGRASRTMLRAKTGPAPPAGHSTLTRVNASCNSKIAPRGVQEHFISAPEASKSAPRGSPRAF